MIMIITCLWSRTWVWLWPWPWISCHHRPSDFILPSPSSSTSPSPSPSPSRTSSPLCIKAGHLSPCPPVWYSRVDFLIPWTPSSRGIAPRSSRVAKPLSIPGIWRKYGGCSVGGAFSYDRTSLFYAYSSYSYFSNLTSLLLLLLPLLVYLTFTFLLLRLLLLSVLF